MDRIILMRGVALTTLALLVSGCYDSFDKPHNGDPEIPLPNTDIASLTKLYTDKTIEITEDVVISGYVSSSDSEGNFYRSLTIEQNGAGVEIMAGADDLCNLYPAGHKLTVKLKGLAIGKNYSVIQIGLPPEPYSSYAVEYISVRPLLERTLFIGSQKRDMTAAERPVDALTGDMCGSLVRIAGLIYAPESGEAQTWKGYKRFVDDDGCEIYCYTSGYAAYADETIPQGHVSLTGILQCGKAGGAGVHYIIKMRGSYDCTEE